MPGFGNTTITVNTKELDRIAKNLKVNTQSALNAMGFQVEEMYKNSVDAQTRRITDSYHGGIYTSTPGRNNPPSINPAEGAFQIPLPDAKDGEVVVGPSVNYAVYIEFGTYKMAARPSLIPSFEAVASDYVSPDKWSIVVEGEYKGDIGAIAKAASL
jgi:hypothetical protein